MKEKKSYTMYNVHDMRQTTRDYDYTWKTAPNNRWKHRSSSSNIRLSPSSFLPIKLSFNCSSLAINTPGFSIHLLAFMHPWSPTMCKFKYPHAYFKKKEAKTHFEYVPTLFPHYLRFAKRTDEKKKEL